MYRIKGWAAVAALCLLGCTACSEEDMPVKGTQDGSVVLRLEGDIVVDNTTTTDFEEYVKTLRLIGVGSDGTVAFNRLLNDLSDYEVKGNDPYKYIEIPLEDNDALPSGAYTIYSVANENVENLSLDGISATDLTSKMITAKSSYSAPSVDNPILMSAINEDILIDPNNQSTTITIGLERVLAKIEYGKVTKKETGESVEVSSHTLTVSGNVLGNYPLFKGEATGSGTTTITSPATDPIYLSESGTDAVTVDLSVVIDDKTYSAVNTLPLTLERNHCYTINGTIDEQSQCLLLNISVANWEVLKEWEEQPLSPTYK